MKTRTNALWDRELIGRGNQYLVSACSGETVSRYHLEAGIAYWHTAPGQSAMKMAPLSCPSITS